MAAPPAASAYSVVQVAEGDCLAGTVFGVARPTSTARQESGDELRRLRGDRRGAAVARSLGWSESKLSRIETARPGSATAIWTACWRRTASAPRRDPAAGPGPAGPRPGVVDAVPVVDAGPVRRVRGARGRGRGDARVGDPGRPGSAADRRVRPRGDRGRRRHRRRRDDPAPARRCGWPGRPSWSGNRRRTLRVVLDEAVLHREVGGREVLRRQLQRLSEASLRPGVELLVLPFSAGAPRLARASPS